MISCHESNQCIHENRINEVFFQFQFKELTVMTWNGIVTMASASQWRVVVTVMWIVPMVRTRPALTAFRTTRTAHCLPPMHLLARMELASSVPMSVTVERTVPTIQMNYFVILKSRKDWCKDTASKIHPFIRNLYCCNSILNYVYTIIQHHFNINTVRF